MENSLDSLGYWSRSDSGHLLPDTGLRSKTDDCGRDHFDYVSVSNLGHVAGNSTIARAGKLYWLVTCHLLIFGSFDALQTWMRTGFGGSRACFLNAGLAAVFHLITRVLTKTESNLSLLFHATLVVAVCFGLAA